MDIFIIAASVIIAVIAVVVISVVCSLTIFSRYMGSPFARSKKDKIETMIELAGLKPDITVVDLGSGDGSVLIAAAEQGARCIGVEINPFLVWYARKRIKKLGFKDKVQIIFANFRNFNLENTDVLFIYLLPKVISELSVKMQKELKPGTKIISNSFAVKGLEPKLSKNGVYLYIKE